MEIRKIYDHGKYLATVVEDEGNVIVTVYETARRITYGMPMETEARNVDHDAHLKELVRHMEERLENG